MDHTQHDHRASVQRLDQIDRFHPDRPFGSTAVDPSLGRRSDTSGAKTRLLADRVVLQFPDLPKATASGLHLPDERFFRRTTRDATVVAVGPGVWREGRMRRGKWVPAVFLPTTLRVGDRVVIDAMKTQTGLLTEWDGERGDFRIVREEDVDLVVESDVGVGVE